MRSQADGSTSEESMSGRKGSLLTRIPVCFISGIYSCNRSKSIGRNAPVLGSSDILIVPPVKSSNTELSFSTAISNEF